MLTKFINVCRMGWDSIWGTLRFYKSKTEEAKRGGMSAIWPILCCRLSITVVSTPPSSMVLHTMKNNLHMNVGSEQFLIQNTISNGLNHGLNNLLANHVKQNYLTINGKGVARKTPIDLLQCSSVQWVMDFIIYGRNCYIWPAHMRWTF